LKKKNKSFFNSRINLILQKLIFLFTICLFNFLNIKRAISSIEQKEESKGSKHINLLREYKKKIESELSGFCNDILELLDTHLIKRAGVIKKRIKRKKKFFIA
jgi:hypothetical protein